LQALALHHHFGSLKALDNVALTVEPGEFVAILGPSGCGKSTLLRAIAGLVRPDSGRLLIDGQDVTETPANERRVGIVFQSYALFPHMTCAQNVSYGLRAAHWPRARITARVAEILTMVRMTDHAGRYPMQLSGGQQQRIAFARTLAVTPKILLLDEPFAALDKKLRLDMQVEVKRLQRELGISAVLVTHDQEEALGLADKLVVMNEGRIQQVGEPQEVYDRPDTAFVAGFVGEMNFLPGRLMSEGVAFAFEVDPDIHIRLTQPRPYSQPGAAMLAVRPEHLELVPPRANLPCGRVEMVMALGARTIVDIEVSKGLRLRAALPSANQSLRPRIGNRVGVKLAEGVPPSVFLP
jgi:putative spermidine/putrescine transport system ATP-binding protein